MSSLDKVLNEKNIERNKYKYGLLKGIKLKKIFIENFRVLKKLNLSLIGSDAKPLPIVLLAGVNGTGKSTIINFILRGFPINDNSFIEFEFENKDSIQTHRICSLESSQITYPELNFFFSENIIYFPLTKDNISNIESDIADFYIKLAEKLDSFKKALAQIHLFIKDIFVDINLGFSINSIDYVNKKVVFKNKNGDLFTIDKLSTGEKTLLSKVLSLFVNNLQNKVILIDEPELSLHPSWQNKVLKIYENFALKNNCQIIIATHSPHIIGSAKNEYIRVLKFNEENQIEVFDGNLAYGRDIEWVLEEVMKSRNNKKRNILKKIKKLKHF